MKVKKASAKPAPKAARKAAKPPVKKVMAKPAKASGLKLAAAKLKKAFMGKAKSAAKPKAAVKPIVKKNLTAAKPKPVPLKGNNHKMIGTMTKSSSAITAPKGLMSEAQVRRMSEKDYMNEAQRAFFQHKLLQMRQEVIDREVEVKERLHEREVFADPADRATAEEEHWLDLRLRERESLLLRKIDEALHRIKANEFGYCEKTGDAIGIPRLLARPTATVCVDIKGQNERVEAQFRDR